MRRTTLILAMLCLSHSALAATSAPGVNLRWDQCYADGGAWNRNSSCSTNAGASHLMLSFELAEDLLDVTGMEVTLDLRSASASWPAWWQFLSVGSCRRSALSGAASPSPFGVVNCADWAEGQGAGGVATSPIGTFGANSARIIGVFAVPTTAAKTLTSGQEYFAGRISISNANTLGTGACAGCETPVCIFLSQIHLNTSNPSHDRWLSQGANFAGSQYVTWQNGYPINVGIVCDNSACISRHASFGCVLATPTNSRGSTWGAVKALYR